MGDGGALAFFQFENPEDQEEFGPKMPASPFHHIALAVDAETQAAIEQRIAAAGIKPPDTFVLEHGYCRSVYVTDPNGLILEFTLDSPKAQEINRVRRAMRTRNSSAGWQAITHPTTPIGSASRRMKHSTDRILTTHVGSLPRSQAVTDVLFARERNEVEDAPAAAAVIADAVAEVVRRQVAVGIDVVSDGEMSKISYATYIAERFSGFGGDTPREPGQDLVEFPGLLKKLAERGSTAKYRRPRCIGEIR